MSRYIDAEPKYIDANSLRQKWLFRGKDGKPYRDEIDAMPAADVVEVVRCKDCKYYKIDHPRANGYHCCYRMHSIFPMKPDDFCSYGERSKDDE